MAIELVKDYCPKDCAYWMGLANGGGTPFCGYAITEHHIRGCPVSQCDKYRKGKRKIKAKKQATDPRHIDVIEWGIVDDAEYD